MKVAPLLYLLLLCPVMALAQSTRIDSLTSSIASTDDINEKAKLLIQRSKAYPTTSTDKPLADAQQALAYYQQTDNKEGQVDAYLQASGVYSRQNKYRLALDFDSTAYTIAVKENYKRGIALAIRGMGRNNLSLGKLEVARDFMLQSLKLMLEANELRDASDLHNQLGVTYRRLSDMKRSLYHFDEGIALARKSNFELSLAYLLMNKANTLNEGGRYEEAIQLHLESIRLKEKLKDDRGLMQSYNNTGLVYKALRQYEQAIDYLSKGNMLARKTNNKTSLANNYSNLADVYQLMGRKDSVAALYEKALALFRETGEEGGVGMVYHNYGHFMLELGKLEEAEDMLKRSLAIREKSKSEHDIASTLNALGVLLSKKGAYREAEQNLLKALALVKGENNVIEKDIYKSLSAHYKQTGEVEEAYKYQASYISISDTLIGVDEIATVLKSQNQYELEKKDAALLLSNKEKEISRLELKQKNTQLYLTLGGIAVLALLLLLAVQAYRRKRKHSAALQTKNSQIETLIRELHHRVKNNLQVVSGLLSLQSNRLSDDKAREAMDEGRSRVDAMAMIHQKLYMNENLAAVDIRDYLENLSLSLANSFGFREKNIETSVSLSKTTLDIDQAIPIGLIVNELVTNAFKHAFDATSDPKVNVSLGETTDGAMELKVTDNGRGFEKASASTVSFGMKLVHTLVEQLNGTMQQEQGKGTTYNIRIRA